MERRSRNPSRLKKLVIASAIAIPLATAAIGGVTEYLTQPNKNEEHYTQNQNNENYTKKKSEFPWRGTLSGFAAPFVLAPVAAVGLIGLGGATRAHEHGAHYS